MMMKMLAAGGVSVLTDGIRGADCDNPEGYFEFEPIQRMRGDPGCLDQAGGKAVKVVSWLLRELPMDRRYPLIFMLREVDEVLSSQRQMLVRRGKSSDLEAEEGLRFAFENHLAATKKWLRERPGIFEVLFVGFAQVHADPHGEAGRVCGFLGGGLDVEAMADSVNPDLYRQRG